MNARRPRGSLCGQPPLGSMSPSLLPMTHPRDYPVVLDRIGIALEATCDALMTSQSIEVLIDVRADDPALRHVADAISHLRQAVDKLRDAQAQGQTGLGLGFVLPQDRCNPSDNGTTNQSSPRRTA